MEQRVFVQHCILVRLARLDAGEHTLSGVTYTYGVPADMEFGEFGNLASGRFALFLRLFGHDAGATQRLVRSHYRDARSNWKELGRFQKEHPIAFPEDGELALDMVVNLPYLRVGAIGLHAMTVHFRPTTKAEDAEGKEGPPGWKPDDDWMDEPGWVHGATEYFEIVGLT
jgi:hypothetical protein